MHSAFLECERYEIVDLTAVRVDSVDNILSQYFYNFYSFEDEIQVFKFALNYGDSNSVGDKVSKTQNICFIIKCRVCKACFMCLAIGGKVYKNMCLSFHQ